MSDQTPPPAPPTIPDLKVGRGVLLGLPIFAVLVIAAILMYLVAGGLGWQGNTRIIVAMCVGPFVGLAAIGLFFYIVRPKVI